MENLTKEQVKAWLMANPLEASGLDAELKDAKKKRAESIAKAYNDATDTIKKDMVKHLAKLADPISQLVKLGYIGIRLELPIVDTKDEAGNGLASSIVGLVASGKGRMTAKRAHNPGGSRAARRTHTVSTGDMTFGAGEWAGYIESYGSADEQATYEAKPNYAGKLADVIAKRLGHTIDYS